MYNILWIIIFSTPFSSPIKNLSCLTSWTIMSDAWDKCWQKLIFDFMIYFNVQFTQNIIKSWHFSSLSGYKQNKILTVSPYKALTPQHLWCPTHALYVHLLHYKQWLTYHIMNCKHFNASITWHQTQNLQKSSMHSVFDPVVWLRDCLFSPPLKFYW